MLLSGERYGWRALPRRVPAAELEALLAHVSDAHAASVAQSWYFVDANSLPEPEAVLRSLDEVKKDPEAPVREFFGPGNAEEIMSTALREAAVSARLPAERLDEWLLSVTHKVSAPSLVNDK